MSRYCVTITMTVQNFVEAESAEDAYDAYHNRDEVIFRDIIDETTESIEEVKDENIQS